MNVMYLIKIEKIREDAEFAEYKFDGGGGKLGHGTGVFRFHKADGEVDILEHTEEHWMQLYAKVVAKLRNLWKLPDKTAYCA